MIDLNNRPCEICGKPTTFERDTKEQAPEGDVCTACGVWVCPECVRYGSGESPYCKHCIRRAEMKKGEDLKYGDLVLVDRKPLVAVIVEGVVLLVDVLTFIDVFNFSKVFERSDVFMADKQGYEFQVLADREEYEGDKVYDELFEKYNFVLPSKILKINKNIA